MKVTIFYMLIGVNIYQFKTKDSETKSYPLCSGNISKGVTVDNMEKKWNGNAYDFSVDYNTMM